MYYLNSTGRIIFDFSMVTRPLFKCDLSVSTPLFPILALYKFKKIMHVSLVLNGVELNRLRCEFNTFKSLSVVYYLNSTGRMIFDSTFMCSQGRSLVRPVGFNAVIFNFGFV